MGATSSLGYNLSLLLRLTCCTITIPIPREKCGIVTTSLKRLKIQNSCHLEGDIDGIMNGNLNGNQNRKGAQMLPEMKERKG